MICEAVYECKLYIRGDSAFGAEKNFDGNVLTTISGADILCSESISGADITTAVINA